MVDRKWYHWYSAWAVSGHPSGPYAVKFTPGFVSDRPVRDLIVSRVKVVQYPWKSSVSKLKSLLFHFRKFSLFFSFWIIRVVSSQTDRTYRSIRFPDSTCSFVSDRPHVLFKQLVYCHLVLHLRNSLTWGFRRRCASKQRQVCCCPGLGCDHLFGVTSGGCHVQIFTKTYQT